MSEVDDAMGKERLLDHSCEGPERAPEGTICRPEERRKDERREKIGKEEERVLICLFKMNHDHAL